MIAKTLPKATLLIATVWLGACGGGSSGDGTGSLADTVTLSIDGGGATSYGLTASTTNLTGYDPLVGGYHDVGSNRTFLSVYAGWSGSTLGGTFNETLDIHFPGSAIGAFDLSAGGTVVNFTRTTPFLNTVSSSGNVTVTAYGAVGGEIRGTFSATSGTHSLSGTFRVTRGADR